MKLRGRVAVVAGATRGAGRGIATMLAEAGAKVYCTGRSSRTAPNTSKHHYAGRPETIEETAELVTAAGGEGIPIRVDHNEEQEIVEEARQAVEQQEAECERPRSPRPQYDGNGPTEGWRAFERTGSAAPLEVDEVEILNRVQCWDDVEEQRVNGDEDHPKPRRYHEDHQW